MSLRAYQAGLARLVADPAFPSRVRLRGRAALPGGLDPREAERLLRLLRDPGVALTATLVASFRLGKVLKALPLACTLIGRERLRLELRAFWRRHPPTSFFTFDEAAAFARHLGRRARAVPGLRDVLEIEKALLEIRRPRPGSPSTAARSIRLRHDPRSLLPPLMAGRRPRRLTRRSCEVRVRLDQSGAPSFEVRRNGRGTASS